MGVSLMLLAALWAAVGEAGERETFAKPAGDVGKAIAMLGAARSASDDAQAREAAEGAVELLGRESPAGQRLVAALAKAGGARTGEALRDAIAAVHEELSFEPRREAELPAGFPTYTPVGAIEVKRYPKNRRAVADDFFTLFAHISTNEIAMTAPVRMEFAKSDAGALKQTSMAFFYGSTETGELGTQGAVTAIEDEGVTVVALGVRGEMSPDAMVEGEKTLRAWLAAHPEFEASGDLIVMGYNSPMVPRTESFMEIQLPVRRGAGEGP